MERRWNWCNNSPVTRLCCCTSWSQASGCDDTGRERCACVSSMRCASVGECNSPFFVFPRKCYKEYFVQSGPTGSAGSGNASGWMQEEAFLLFLNHCKTHKDQRKKVLLLLDNHCSHISVKAINFCLLPLLVEHSLSSDQPASLHSLSSSNAYHRFVTLK